LQHVKVRLRVMISVKVRVRFRVMVGLGLWSDLWWQGLVSFPDGKNGLVNSLFHSHSIYRNNGRPIMLRCVSDVIHGNNGNQESWAIKAVCRRLGYAVLKPDHKKAVRSFMNALKNYVWELDNRHWKFWMPIRLLQSLSFFFPGSYFLGDCNLQGRQSLQWSISGRHYCVPK